MIQMASQIGNTWNNTLKCLWQRSNCNTCKQGRRNENGGGDSPCRFTFSCSKDDPVILRMFGSAQPVRRSRLQFVDSFVTNAVSFQKVGLTEVKTENGINRMTSVANPRQIERVVPGVKFGVRIVYDVVDPDEITEDMEQLAHAMRLLQLDYLGGHGSRGSGRVSLSGFSFEQMESDFPQEQLKAIFDKVDQYELLPV